MAIVLCLFQKVLTFPDGSERCSLLRVEANLLQSHYTAHHTAGCHANGKKGPHLQQSKGKPQIPTNKGTFICGYMWIYVYICMCTCVHNMYYTESGVHLTHVVVSECMQGWMHKVCFLPTRCQRRGQVAEGTTARQDNANTEHRVAPTQLTSQDGTL